MNHDLSRQMADCYELETRLLKLGHREQELTEKLKLAQSDHYQCRQALVGYDCGTIRSFLDRLSGKREQKLDEMNRQVRAAESKVQILRREMESIRQEQAEAVQALALMPDPGNLVAQDPSLAREAARLDALYCVQALIPLLENNLAALGAAHDLMRGVRAGEIISYAERQEIYTAPEKTAEDCKILLLRLETAMNTLERPFLIGDYYRSPTGYTAAASEQVRRDRMNQSLRQARETLRQVKNLSETINDREI